ncbi:ribbon-helix-helix domain-containing protein [Patescibacteria group bacterium AH-259-L07]|nr:ribbon-helix-helix domain-containing protein [Patescibacteria group bacterium AH-259-L07]
MRNVINISLPEKMVKIVKKEVKAEGYASVSEFFRHLIREWNTRKLAQELKKDRQDFESGKGKVLRSLKDLR